MPSLPLLFHPTTVLWVDDDSLFLEAGTESIGQHVRLHTLSSAQECLSFFNHYHSLYNACTFLQADKQHETYDLQQHCPVDVNLNALAVIQDNPQRHQEISVMIVDYNMPGQNGLELCQALSASPIKKILLTGDANLQQAVDAFNQGLIDCFIRKDHPRLAQELIFHIHKLQNDFFSHVTRPLLTHLEADTLLAASDPDFVKLFKNWCEKHRIVEYYITDKNATFVAYSEMRECYYFVTHTEYRLTQFMQLYADDSEAQPFLKEMQLGIRFPFFGTNKEPWHIEFANWSAHFYPFEKLEAGSHRYYWLSLPHSETL